VLRLLADGLGQQDIAERLVISPKTVATYIERILKKARCAEPGSGCRRRLSRAPRREL